MRGHGVRAGWRGLAVPVILALAIALSGPARAQPANTIVISNVTLIDGTGAPPIDGASVIVTGKRIVLVSPGPVQSPPGATIIDGTGRYLIPGLIDSHIHLQGGRVPVAGGGTRIDRRLAMRTLHGYLYSGVTSVFDSGNNADFIFALRDEERAGSIVAPRIFATGANITSPGGYADSLFTISVGEYDPDARKRLQTHFDRRPDVQKLLYDGLGTFGRPLAPVFSRDTLEQVIAQANAGGISTTAHAETEAEARTALAAGIGGFAHPVRAAVTDEFVRTLAVRRVPVSTTLTVFSHIAMIADDTAFLDAPLFRATLEPDQIEFQKVAERRRYISSGMAAQFAVMLPHLRATVKKMHEGGVILALGTDRTWGASVHMELDLLHKAGIPLADLVRIATLNAATYLHREHELGSIERGKLADMVMLRADPTKDIAAYGAIDMVIKNGTIVDRDRLDLPVNRNSDQ